MVYYKVEISIKIDRVRNMMRHKSQAGIITLQKLNVLARLESIVNKFEDAVITRWIFMFIYSA